MNREHKLLDEAGKRSSAWASKFGSAHDSANVVPEDDSVLGKAPREKDLAGLGSGR